MKVIKKIALLGLLGFVLMIAAFDLWGFFTLGSITPAEEPARDKNANAVVMVFGATGSVGDGLLKAAIEDPNVKKVYVVTRSTSPRMEAGANSGKVEIRMHQDFTDYSSLADILGSGQHRNVGARNHFLGCR